MKKINKTCLVFILLLVLSIGVIFLPVGFALQSPEDLVGKVYNSSIVEQEMVNLLGKNEKDDYFSLYFYSSEESLNEDINSHGMYWGPEIVNYRSGYHKICSVSADYSYLGYGGTRESCIENGTNKLSNISNYWKVVKYLERSAYTQYNYALIPYEYKEPTYELSCNPQKISIGEYSTCSLKATYYSKLKNIDFNLNIKDYEISDIKAGDDFENLKVEDNNYSLTGKNSMEESDEGNETTIITFRITSPTNKEVNAKDNIKIKNINYKDQVEEGTKNFVTATVKQEPTNNDGNSEILKNPNTGDKLLVIVLFIITITILGICTIIYRKKKSRYKV